MAVNILNIVQRSPLSTSRTFSSSKQKMFTYKTKTLSSPVPQSLVISVLLSVFPMNLPFLVLHVSGITQYSSLCVWLISLCVMLSSFIHIVMCIGISCFLRGSNIPSYVYTPCFVHPFICWWKLELFPPFSYCAAKNIGIKLSV